MASDKNHQEDVRMTGFVGLTLQHAIFSSGQCRHYNMLCWLGVAACYVFIFLAPHDVLALYSCLIGRGRCGGRGHHGDSDQHLPARGGQSLSRGDSHADFERTDSILGPSAPGKGEVESCRCCGCGRTRGKRGGRESSYTTRRVDSRSMAQVSVLAPRVLQPTTV